MALRRLKECNMNPQIERPNGETSPDRDIRNHFEGITNKTITEPSGEQFVQIRHDRQLHRVDIVKSLYELEGVKQLDDEAFGVHQGISIDELDFLTKNGRVFVLRNEENILVAESQLQITPGGIGMNFPEDEAYCYGTAIKPGYEGQGYAQILYKAQEVSAREAEKKAMTLTVRVENARSIRARLKAGFRITGYDPNYYGPIEEGGARLIIKKDLINESFPFIPQRQIDRLLDGKIPVINESNATTILTWQPPEIALPTHVSDTADLSAHALIQSAVKNGYVGNGLLRPDEIVTEVGEQSFFIFHNKNSLPRTETVIHTPSVNSEFGHLREVIVSYPPENAAIKEGTINKTAIANIGNVDTISFKEEYIDFLHTLENQGVHLTYTNVLGTDGAAPIFTRDPAFVIGDTIVIGSLTKEKRAFETAGMRRIADGKKILDLPLIAKRDARIEGGDVVLLGNKRVAVGLGTRTNEAGLYELQKYFPEYTFMGIPHGDLHLDVLFTMVGEKKALADTTKLPYAFLRNLINEGFTIIEADPSEQVPLGCNIVAINNDVVIAATQNHKTNASLERNGVQVIKVNMPNITKKGGGPRCMTCPTNRD